MHLIAIITLLVLGAMGVWLGFVEDMEMAFLIGIAAWGVATVAVFRGNFNPPDELRNKGKIFFQTGAFSALIVALMILGAAAVWIGFVEGIKISFLGALVIWGATVYLAFGGTLSLGLPRIASVSTGPVGTIGVVAIVIGGMLIGSVGIWLGLVENLKIGFAAGLLVWAGTVFTTFRGKVAFS